MKDFRTPAEKRAADEALRRTNPLQIMCAECFHVCVLSRDGKRWLCQWGHGNERINDEDAQVLPFR